MQFNLSVPPSRCLSVSLSLRPSVPLSSYLLAVIALARLICISLNR
jgi:hypothetical protein